MALSVFEKILNDVSALCVLPGDALSQTPNIKVVVRKTIFRYEGDPLPLIVITPGTDKVEEEAFEGQLRLIYPVYVAIIYGGNMGLETGLGQILQARETIRQKCYTTTLATATTVFDSRLDLEPPYDLKALDKNYEYSLMRIDYLSQENRNS